MLLKHFKYLKDKTQKTHYSGRPWYVSEFIR